VNNALIVLFLPGDSAREAELIAIFKEATRLEIEFWEMGWRAGQRGE
jgi:thiaminase